LAISKGIPAETLSGSQKCQQTILLCPTCCSCYCRCVWCCCRSNTCSCGW